MIPPTDERGRFVPVLRDGSILKRLFARGLDAVLSGGATLVLSRVMPLPLASLLCVSWFCLSDWSGSPGKWLLRLRVVMVDGSQVTAIAALKRNVVLGLPTFGRALITAGWSGLEGDAGMWDRGVLACVGLAVAFGEVLGMILQPQNRRWGDHIAGTRVVER